MKAKQLEKAARRAEREAAEQKSRADREKLAQQTGARKPTFKAPASEMKMQFALDNKQSKLREILEDSEEEYNVPFADPQELIDIFSTLEEQNLFLIQQGQENEQQIEQKKIEQAYHEEIMEADIDGLTSSEQQVKDRMNKTLLEKTALQQIVNSGSNKMLADSVYHRLCADIVKVFRQVKPQHPDAGEVPPLTQLLEIERFIEDCAFFQARAKEKNPKDIEQKIKKSKEDQKILTKELKVERDRRLKEEQQEERRKKDEMRVVKVGGHPLMARSEKPLLRKNKEEKKSLTQEEIDQLKYLGELAQPVPVKR